MVLSSAIVCDHDRRIADDRRSSFHMIADDRRRSAICDHMETSLKWTLRTLWERNQMNSWSFPGAFSRTKWTRKNFKKWIIHSDTVHLREETLIGSFSRCTLIKQDLQFFISFDMTMLLKHTIYSVHSVHLVLFSVSVPHRAQRSQIWRKFRLNSLRNCAANQVCWYKNVIEQSDMRSYYASVERLLRPQSLMHATCVLAIIFQQTRNKIPWRFFQSLSCVKQTRFTTQFPSEFSRNLHQIRLICATGQPSLFYTLSRQEATN